ncbi:MAG: hypothetical protein Q4G39_08305 [Brachymonas sp.]|nr:hypothetical protein [Brachymonas sp.]
MLHTKTVPIYKGEVKMEGTLCFVEIDAERYEIEVTLDGARFFGRGDDYFDAMIEARKQLEASGLLLGIYGASRNVWPSPMSRSMGEGIKAYRMTMGRQALSKDLVHIFDSGPDVLPSTIAEQEAYKNAWFDSLG